MGEGLPPQRRQGGIRHAPGSQRGGRGPASNPREGAEEAERRLGLPCFHAGQKVQGLFGCVACQFQIRNRAKLPGCPECGELVWVYLDQGPRPVPEGEEPGQEPAPVAEASGPVVQENVKLDAPVSVQENVKLDP